MSYPNPRASYPVTPLAAQRLARHTLFWFIKFFGILLVLTLILYYFSSWSGLRWPAKLNNTFVTALYLVGYLLIVWFLVFGSAFKFQSNAVLHFGDFKLWWVNSKHPTLDADFDANDNPKLHLGEHCIAYESITTARIDANGITLSVDNPDLLTGTGKVFIPSIMDEYSDILRQVNVLGDRYHWKFPNDKKRQEGW